METEWQFECGYDWEIYTGEAFSVEFVQGYLASNEPGAYLCLWDLSTEEYLRVYGSGSSFLIEGAPDEEEGYREFVLARSDFSEELISLPGLPGPEQVTKVATTEVFTGEEVVQILNHFYQFKQLDPTWERLPKKHF